MLQRLWAHRAVRWPISIAFAFGLAAYLTLGDVPSVYEPDTDVSAFLVLSALGIALLVAAAGWHSLWLMPVSTAAFAWTYEAYFWTRPPGIGGGMDYLAFYPSSAVLLMVFAVPFATCLAIFRTALILHRTR